MATATAETERLPRANMRPADNPFPASQYVKIPNVAVFSEHETKTPDGKPQNFDKKALWRLIDRGNQRIRKSGDYAAITVGHTHDPDDPVQEQPEVIGAMGPYRLGTLGHPGQPQKYAILADLWIRRDKIDLYNSNPRRSVELWYEHDQPAWIDPLSLLAEAPRLDLGLTPLVDAKGGDGAESGLKYLYAAQFHGRRVVKYAAACASGTNAFVPAEGESKPRHYAAGTTPTNARKPLMLAPEEIRQIVDAIEQLDWVQGVKDMLTAQAGAGGSTPAPEPAAELEPEAGGGAEGQPAAPDGTPEHEHAETPATEAAEHKPLEKPDEKPVKHGADEDADTLTTKPSGPPTVGPLPVRHSADESLKPKPKDEKAGVGQRLEDLSEEEIERYLCDLKKKRYAAEGSADGEHRDGQPAQGSVDPGQGAPGEGSASGESQKAKYSMLEAKIAALEADKAGRTNETRKAKLQQLRYHRAFDLDKEIARSCYSKMNDEQFSGHCELLAEVATPTLVNQAMPVPDELLDTRQPPPALRQGPEKYSKETVDRAVKYVIDKAAAGVAVNYEEVLEKAVKGLPLE